MSAPADVQAVDVEDLGLDGMAATVRTPVGTRTVRTALLGRGNLANVLAAVAVALYYDVPLDGIVERASSLRPAPRRGEVFRLAGGVTLVDDSYNSNPRALRIALQVVGREQRCARRVAVLGEMLELGRHADHLHRESGRAAAAAGLARLVAVGGPAAMALADEAVAAGMPASSVLHLATSQEAADRIESIVAPGDVVLVKGSRGTRTDIVADRLRALFGVEAR
jgi:UDP-N-acetylmuramoyl-tripeptide--D-alanyl-D-alanine ligase